MLLWLVRRSWRLRKAIAFQVQTDAITIPVYDGLGLGLLSDEDYLSAEIRVALSRGRGAFIDVGANVGKIMLELLRIDPAVPYLGFEPQIRAADYLSRLIELNGLSGSHRVLPVGLADRSGVARIGKNAPTDVGATLSVDKWPVGTFDVSESICLFRGDEILDEIEDIAVIKIDVEGAENEVLDGLQRTISRHRPALIVEVMRYQRLIDGSHPDYGVGPLSETVRQTLIERRKAHVRDLARRFEVLDYVVLQTRDGLALPSDLDSMAFASYDYLMLPRERLCDYSGVRMEGG